MQNQKKSDRPGTPEELAQDFLDFFIKQETGAQAIILACAQIEQILKDYNQTWTSYASGYPAAETLVKELEELKTKNEMMGAFLVSDLFRAVDFILEYLSLEGDVTKSSYCYPLLRGILCQIYSEDALSVAESLLIDKPADFLSELKNNLRRARTAPETHIREVNSLFSVLPGHGCDDKDIEGSFCEGSGIDDSQDVLDEVLNSAWEASNQFLLFLFGGDHPSGDNGPQLPVVRRDSSQKLKA